MSCIPDLALACCCKDWRLLSPCISMSNHKQSILCRSHKDLMKEAAPHYKKARKFYDGLAAQLVQQGHALDVFACSLDQVDPARHLHSTWHCSHFSEQNVQLLTFVSGEKSKLSAMLSCMGSKLKSLSCQREELLPHNLLLPGWACRDAVSCGADRWSACTSLHLSQSGLSRILSQGVCST